jgi:hypothetical protein
LAGAATVRGLRRAVIVHPGDLASSARTNFATAKIIRVADVRLHPRG